jgi:hypothetical protein
VCLRVCVRAIVAGQDYIGEFETTLGAIVGAPRSTLTKELVDNKTGGRKRGNITIKCNSVAGGADVLVIQVSGRRLSSAVGVCRVIAGASSPSPLFVSQFAGAKLDKKDWFGKSDPFLVISRVLVRAAVRRRW